MPVSAANLGFPRIGPCRELGSAEGRRNPDHPSNDFSFYDQVFDTSVMVVAILDIYRFVLSENAWC